MGEEARNKARKENKPNQIKSNQIKSNQIKSNQIKQTKTQTFSARQRLNNPNTEEIQITWIGHACFLVQVSGFNIITDAALSERCSPTQLLGPKRYRPIPIEISDLPQLDAFVLSHNHYDHLDYHSFHRYARFNDPRVARSSSSSSSSSYTLYFAAA